MKLIIGISKKLGLPGYSSVGALCQIESSEFAGGLRADEFRRRVERAFDSCRAAVDAELRRHVPGGGEDGFAEAAPVAARPATANQLQALRTLVARTRLAPQELNKIFLGKAVESLSTSEASAAISQLRGAASANAAAANGFHEGGT
jgi:hypothetical protein